MKNNELPKEDLNLIAQIDARLKHYNLIAPIEQVEEVEYVEFTTPIHNIKVGQIYPIDFTSKPKTILTPNASYEYEAYELYVKPSTKSSYLSQQEQPKSIVKEEVKERWRVSVEPFAEHRDDVKIVISLNDGFISDGGGHHLATQIKALLQTL